MTCNCLAAGYCETYRREMSDRNVLICRGEVLTPEKCEAYRDHWRKIAAGEIVVPESKVVILAGVGDHLAAIFRALAVGKIAGCGCDGMIAQMNVWGPDGCREHRDEILAHLRKAYDQSSLPTKASAGLMALGKNTLAIVGLSDGTPMTLEGLLDLAIERATETAGGKPEASDAAGSTPS
jgi:hypothetical protein